MVIGFTGTRRGMTKKQSLTVEDLLEELLDVVDERGDDVSFRHGDCIGSDEEFHEIVCQIVKPANFVLYPGHNAQGESPTRAFCKGGVIQVMPPALYLTRDTKIAQVSDVLIAAPQTAHEINRSGTWATVRRARRFHKTIYIVRPNGEVGHEIGGEVN